MTSWSATPLPSATAKKPSSYYMRVLKEAKRRSIEEFAVALGVTEEDAEARLAQAALN